MKTSSGTPSAARALRDFIASLRKAKRGTGVNYGRKVAEVAFELRSALSGLKEGLDDPREGVKALADFFRCDEKLSTCATIQTGFSTMCSPSMRPNSLCIMRRTAMTRSGSRIIRLQSLPYRNGSHVFVDDVKHP